MVLDCLTTLREEKHDFWTQQKHKIILQRGTSVMAQWLKSNLYVVFILYKISNYVEYHPLPAVLQSVCYQKHFKTFNQLDSR